MNMLRTAALAATIALASTAASLPANAQNKRSFVSGHGNDANPCQLAAPCRSFQRAHDVTNAGGEISILDVAGYGLVTITKAISIVNDGVGEAGITFNGSSDGITINAGANDTVYLRGLTIEGGGVGHDGIVFNTGKALTVENCIIRHLTNRGINFLPNAASGLWVSNTVASDNGDNGIFVAPSGSATVTAVFNRVETNNNGLTGVFVLSGAGPVNAVVYESISSGNGGGGAGFFPQSNSGQAATMTVFNSVAADNGFGLFTSGTGATLLISHSIVTGNVSGWGGTVLSAGDNTIEGNQTSQTAPPSYALK